MSEIQVLGIVSSSWTAERVAILRKLYEAGLSFSLIADELACGLTRNAVIGKAHRLGLNARKIASGGLGDVNTPRRTAKPIGRPRTRTNNITWREQGPEATALPPTPTEVATSPVTFFELRLEHCRWPVSGEGIGAVFCGGQVADKQSYCALHYRMAYRKPEPRARRKHFVSKFRSAV